MYNTIIGSHMAPTLRNQMVYFYPGYDSVTCWHRQQIKMFDRSPLLIVHLQHFVFKFGYCCQVPDKLFIQPNLNPGKYTLVRINCE